MRKPVQPLANRLNSLRDAVAEVWPRLNIEPKSQSLTELDDQLATSEVWLNPEHAQNLSKQAAKLRTEIEPWQTLHAQADGLVDFLELADGDQSMITEIDDQVAALEATYDKLKFELMYDGPYDSHDAIIKLSAGAGGVDAQDWTQMLERMYLRWAEKSGLKAELIERSAGEEAGIKSATYSISGVKAYGKLRSEHGVHRLVRLSPYNADNLRQTSFALVEVTPAIDAPEELAIDDGDLRVDVYRAGGHGGQSVNTTDSAVRITHLPTGVSVAIQNERSQLQNKETAMKILRSKLAGMQLEQHAEDLATLKGPNKEAAWGNQIRNYVLHPYSLVKDTRTKHESRDTSAVLDGQIDEFIESFLSSCEKNHM